MQQPQQNTNMPPFPLPNITTAQIQQMLDENKKLIHALLDNQNLGKYADCAVYQVQLQKNLMFLAAIADSQLPVAQPKQQTSVPPETQEQQQFHQPQLMHGQVDMGQAAVSTMRDESTATAAIPYFQNLHLSGDNNAK